MFSKYLTSPQIPKPNRYLEITVQVTVGAGDHVRAPEATLSAPTGTSGIMQGGQQRASWPRGSAQPLPEAFCHAGSEKVATG